MVLTLWKLSVSKLSHLSHILSKCSWEATKKEPSHTYICNRNYCKKFLKPALFQISHLAKDTHLTMAVSSNKPVPTPATSLCNQWICFKAAYMDVSFFSLKNFPLPQPLCMCLWWITFWMAISCYSQVNSLFWRVSLSVAYFRLTAFTDDRCLNQLLRCRQCKCF